MDGILILDKPIGLTCRQIDNAIMKALGSKKVGHLGTLDPFASGVLVIAVNKGTKFLPYLGGGVKSYLATLKLGEATDTLDNEGQIVMRAPVPRLNEKQVAAALKEFLGESAQLSPAYSAVKIDGKPAYKYAREGQEVKRKQRTIEVYDVNLLQYKPPYIDFSLTVSEGTYIRVIGEDLAKKLGTLGHLTALRRLSVGKFSLKDALPYTASSFASLLDPTPYVDLPRLELTGEQLKKAYSGMKLKLDSQEAKILLLDEGKPVAVYYKDEDFHRAERGLF